MLIELWYWRFSNYRYSNYLMMKILSSSIFPYIYILIIVSIQYSWILEFFNGFSPSFRALNSDCIDQELMVLRQQLFSLLFEAVDVVWAQEKGRRGAVLLALRRRLLRRMRRPREEKKDESSGKRCGIHVESIRNLREKWWTMWIMVDIHQRNGCEDRNNLI